MEIQQLRCFVAVADHGTFTAAAVALHLTQPSVSHAIARLESELRVRLFHRATRGIYLTTEGEDLLVRARDVLRAAESVRTTASAFRGVTQGTLTVVAFRTFTIPTASAVGRFRRQYPGVTVRLHAPETDRGVIELIESHVCDVGFARVVDVPPGLAVEEVTTEHLGVLLPPEISAGIGPGALTLAEVAALPLITPRSDSVGRVQMEGMFHRAGLEITVVAESSHYESMIAMVRAGVGAALAFRESLPEGTPLADFRLMAPAQGAGVGLVYRPDDLSAVGNAFRSVATRFFARPPEGTPTSSSGDRAATTSHD